MKKPEILKEINLDRLKEICQNYIDYIDSDDFHEDNDFEYFIFETALEAIYGVNIFDYINSKTD